MLSMKTLRVAIVADTSVEDNTLTDVNYTGVYTSEGVPLTDMVHSSGGGVGDDYVVFRLDFGTEGLDLDGPGSGDSVMNIPVNLGMFDANDADPSDPPADLDVNDSESCDVPAGPTKVWANVKGLLAIPAGPGAYTASITMHTDPDAAQAGTGASSALNGEATIVAAVNALDVEVMALQQPAVAHVGTSPQPFLWFKSSGSTPTVSHAVLGHAKAAIGATGLLTPTGGIATAQDLIPDSSLTLTVEGDFSIGAFNLKEATAATANTICPPQGKASAEEPVEGNLAPAEDGPANIASINEQDAGTYFLCVQVDTQGPNSTPIPATTYNGTITSGTGATARDLASNVIGQIRRNGTTVKLTYLTVSSKYNQRLIIVNDGVNDANYDIGPFVTEDGTTAQPKAKASGMVSAGEQMVLRMEDVVEFEGPQARASATLSMNADVDDVQVATTQVNLEDGSTDTVIYAAEGGAEVN